MLHSRRLYNKINSQHERALNVTLGGKNSSFQNLLEKDNFISKHQKYLQHLLPEMLKLHNNVVSEILNNIFILRTMRYD